MSDKTSLEKSNLNERGLTEEQAKWEEETECCWFCGANPCQQAKNCPYIEDAIANG